MDLRQLENIIRINEERSITKAAEKLFITQSALNQQLQKLEAELGTPLFVRTRSDWRPTPAGEVYLDAARQILNIKRDAYHRIHDMADLARHHFTIGLIPERGVDMFTAIYPEFHRRFPDAVSYTHLDVYKRQAIDSSRCLMNGLEKRSRTAAPNLRLSSVSPMVGMISSKMHFFSSAETFSSFRHSPTVSRP